MPPIRERWQRWLGWGIFASWFVLDGILLTLVEAYARWQSRGGRSPTDEMICVVLVLLFAQIGFASWWLVFGPGSLALRIPALVGNLVISATIFLRFIADRSGLEEQLLIFFLTLFGGLQLAILAPLLMVQRTTGYYAVWCDARETKASFQISLKHLFAWMFVASLLIVLVQRILANLPLMEAYMLKPKDLLALGLLVVGGMMQPLLAGTFLTRPMKITAWLKLASLSLLVSAAVMSPAFFVGEFLDWLVLTIVIFGQFLMLSFYLVLLRMAGLELVSQGTAVIQSTQETFLGGRDSRRAEK